MSALAIDIGTYSIKIVTGQPGKNPTITRNVEVFNNLGFALPADDTQAQKLGELVSNIINDHKLSRNDLRLSLPETLVATKVIELPNLSDSELASAIGWQAEQHIPIPKEDLSLQYQILFRPPKGDKQVQMRVLLIGAKKSIVERYTNMFVDIGIEPALLETQMISITRTLQLTPDEPSTLIAHIGASSMDLSLIHQGEIQFIFTHPAGGHLLTKSLQQNIGLDSQQSEEYKRNFGLDERQFEGKVRNALLPVVQTLVGEIQKSMRYFTNQHPQESVKRVVLSGGSSQLPGLVEHIAQALGVEVLLVSPFTTAKGEIPQANHQAMSVCLGLLMRED